MKTEINVKKLVIIVLIVSIWINISEVFRYFIIVRPEMHSYLSMVPNVADMNSGIFVLWGIWDTVLSFLVVFSFWLMAEKFGYNSKTVVWAGTFSWTWLFFMFWFASANMNLSSWEFIIIPLLLSFIEMIVASWLSLKLFSKYKVLL